MDNKDKKTFLKLSEPMSIIILCSFFVLMSFFTNIQSIDNVGYFIFAIFRSLVFISIPTAVYFIEHEKEKIKKVAAIYLGLYFLSLLVVIIYSITMAKGSFNLIGGIINTVIGLLIALCTILIIIEQILIIKNVEQSFYYKTINILYKYTSYATKPFTLILDKLYEKNLQEKTKEKETE